MDQKSNSMENDVLYPVLLIPRKCTSLETNCEVTENVFIDLNITTPDVEGNSTNIYSGFCNVKLVDSYDVNIQQEPNLDQDLPVIISEANTYTPYTQSQVWIDPSRSPYVYNNYESVNPPENSSYSQHTGCVTVEHRNTYITQNVYNYKEYINYSPCDENEQKKLRRLQETLPNSDLNLNLYEEDEFECGVFLSQLPEEILNEKEVRAREEKKYIGLQSDNGALKQLMSTNIQSVSKQRRTILFLGHDSQSGQTIQNIMINDPAVQCSSSNKDSKMVKVSDSLTKTPTNPHQKKYQCDKCKQIFDQIGEFKQHMTGNHKSTVYNMNSKPIGELKYMCTQCGKTLKNQKKFQLHCMGHGDPERECHKCHKVFASKFTLRSHQKIHNRRYPCLYCFKSFINQEDLTAHTAKVHYVHMCEVCNFSCNSYSQLIKHKNTHKHLTGSDLTESYLDEINCEKDIIQSHERNITFSEIKEDKNVEVNQKNEMQDSNEPLGDKDLMGEEMDITDEQNEDSTIDDDPDFDPEGMSEDKDMMEEAVLFENISESEQMEQNRKADSVIAKVMSNEYFLKSKRYSRRHDKACDVCLKTFDRIGDLKRHLIEHIIRSTLSKMPINKDGTISIQCEVCRSEVFTKIDQYKAHLREHAKLTLYKCTFCNKSFSDSSNFSKHKKIHGSLYLQCDLCQRKFNSKKMITQHMEYHKKHSPLQCRYCFKIFHFESMLNKHIKCAHTKETSSRFRCRFCLNYFRTLKDKWDHEWSIHNVRKMIVDCLTCGSKFRKYSELKRHCSDEHDMDIPTAKKLLKKKNKIH